MTEVAEKGSISYSYFSYFDIIILILMAGMGIYWYVFRHRRNELSTFQELTDAKTLDKRYITDGQCSQSLCKEELTANNTGRNVSIETICEEQNPEYAGQETSAVRIQVKFDDASDIVDEPATTVPSSQETDPLKYIKSETKNNTEVEMGGAKKRKTCESCVKKGMSSTRPTHFCMECYEVHCDVCATRHKHQNMAHNHVLIPLTDQQNPFKPDDNSTNADTMQWKNANTARRPGKPCVKSITTDNVSLGWNPSEEVFANYSYQLRYKECNSEMKWSFYQESLAHPSVTLHNLKSGTKFVFQVRMVDDENEGPYSELSDPILTNYVDTTLENKTEKARRPGKPRMSSVTIDGVSLIWDPPKRLFTDSKYQLRYKECCTPVKWVFYPESLELPSVTLHNLKSGAQFVLQVRMVDDDNEGPYSELSDPITNIVDTTLGKSTNDATRPGKPCVASTTIDKVSLVWAPPDELFKEHSYQLRYKECNSQMKWIYLQDTLTHHSASLQNLKSGTQFVFRVRMIDNDNEGPFSEPSDPIETEVSAAESLLEFMHDVKTDIGIKLMGLPLQENRNARNRTWKTRKLVLGRDKGISLKERTILLVGAMGTGKSTLVDGMINYVLGVKWSDPYRVTLVNLEEDERNRNVDQAVSQTQWITCYTINPYRGGRLDYKLNIIDTPGFGDTRGIERDKQIVQQIKHLFSMEDDAGVLFIDAVCFIIKAPDARLTPSQRYIFSAIMSLFGQDIENNFSMLITFADGKPPPVLSALKSAHLPHDEYFPFNSSGLFADNSGSAECEFASMFWNMGCQSFEKFFKRLAMMETKSLRQTRDVLTYREQVEVTLENLLPLVDAGLTKVEEMRKEIAILKDFKTQIEANSDFKYTVSETQQVQAELPKGQHVTNCLNCHFTCHKCCMLPNDEDKKLCWAMDENGFCKQCPDNCEWNMHKNTPYIFEYISVTKEKTYGEKLEKYRLATDETMTRKKVVERMHEEMVDLEDGIFVKMEQINEFNNELRKIALRPDPLSFVEHIDLLIEGEKQEKNPGFKERIESLQHHRRRATIGDDVDRLHDSYSNTKSNLKVKEKLPVKRKSKTRKIVPISLQPLYNYLTKK